MRDRDKGFCGTSYSLWLYDESSEDDMTFNVVNIIIN
jgi:hypothetical protein